MDNIGFTRVLKLLGVILLIIFGLWIILSLFSGTNFGINFGYRGGYQGGHMNMGIGAGYGTVGTISVFLLLLVKILFVLFIIGLVVGIAIAVKRLLFSEEDIENIKCTFTGKKTVIIKEACVTCGKEQNDEWKVCPYCGKEKAAKNV